MASNNNPESSKSPEQIDVRGFWNAVEKLANTGHTEDAKFLSELANDPIIRKRMDELAQEGNISGGYSLAEESAERTLGLNEETNSAIKDTLK